MRTLLHNTYALLGYDKDNDNYEIIRTGDDLNALIEKGREIAEIQTEKDCFISKSTNEPFDWFVICDKNDVAYPMHPYWTSYEN